MGEIGRFAALNLGAGEATGDYLAFVDSSVVVEDPGWLRELMMLAQREDILAAIPALFDGRGRILHAGYALGMERVASCRQPGTAPHGGGLARPGAHRPQRGRGERRLPAHAPGMLSTL